MKRKPVGALQVDVVSGEDVESEPMASEPFLQEVEAFLLEHEQQVSVEDEPPFTEQEAAEALAVSWKERRKEISKVQKSRQFGYASTAKRQFRIEVEELKKRTKCNRCGKVGHWARECRAPPTKDASSSSAPPTTAVSYVEVEEETELAMQPTFVGHVVHVYAAGLVSSPGFGVVDSGCGKTLIGEQTLKQLEPMIQAAGFGPVVYYTNEAIFRFGNGATETTHRACRLPVGSAQCFGTIDAAIISGAAPLLLGRPTLERMAVKLDFAQGQMELLGHTADLKTNEAGQLLIDVLAYPDKGAPVANTQATSSPQACSPRPEQCPEIQAGKGQKTKITLKKKECRCLLAQIKKQEAQKSATVAVAELFSPPRFTKAAEAQNLQGLSYDIKQGWDLTKPNVQNTVTTELEHSQPSLLVVCPLTGEAGSI